MALGSMRRGRGDGGVMSAGGIETPSGKGAGDENFQVGSILLPARLRPHVLAFYRFVRAADDIADNPKLTAADKLARLDAFQRALVGRAGEDFPKARALRKSLAATGVTPRHACDLLAAFRQDATKLRYADWPDLLGYCALSASPVGRYLLDLHGEDPSLWALSDPLCDALQILNHLQDCQADYLALGRVYLPLDAFAAAGISVEALGEARASPALRQVLDRTLDGTDGLLARAADLPRALASHRLAAESGVILAMAQRLSHRLRRQDPLAARVELGKPAFLLTALAGLGGTLARRLAGGRAARVRALAPGK
jgi:hydroxysqualene synthase